MEMVIKRLILVIFCVLFLSSCAIFNAGDSSHKKQAIAENIADAARMSQYIIPAGLFDITAWGHIDMPSKPINIYIEGDGKAWLSKYRKSLDPTPSDPIALKLAAIDNGPNVIYLARPCQYSGWRGDGTCPNFYWTNGRTAPEVVEAYQIALDKIRESYGPDYFNLIGYSGGASVALLVAAGRTDIGSIRTVAGNLDYDVFTSYHGVSPMAHSQNPVKVAHLLTKIPQVHFIGEEDSVVTIDLFKSWQQASGSIRCVKHVLVHDVNHYKGWAEEWRDLLARDPLCF